MKAIYTQHKRTLLAFEIVILIGLLLPPSLFHSFGCTSSSSAIRTNYHSSNGYYIDNQVIVIGTGGDFQKVIDPLGLIQIEGCDLSYLKTRGFSKWLGFIPIPPRDEKVNILFINSAVAGNQQNSLLMRLYEIPNDSPYKDFPDENSPVENVIKQINDANANEGSNLFADPNYLTRLTDSTINPCARPSDSGGTGGGPFGEPGMPIFNEGNEQYNAMNAENAFKNQWAFGNQGINLPSSPSLKGRWVRIGVFDTSPFRPREYLYTKIEIGLPHPFWIKSRDAVGVPMMSNHGLFVAGLIHKIAPKSRIQLIRVLNDDGCGELWALNGALEDYTSRMSLWTGRLDKTVINLSLGIRAKPNGTNQEDAKTEKEVKTLNSIIAHAYDLGAIFVAAAGNDIPEDQNNPVPMEIPAKYDNVIGVAATSMNGERACYSNKGNVAAPGGGIPADSTEPCEPRTSNWDVEPSSCSPNDMANCPYGLISLAQTRYGEQYIFWSGTSFSTPLVSGLAALLYEKGDHDKIRCMIENGSSESGRSTPNDIWGWGIINVSQSINLDPETLDCPLLPSDP